MSDVVEEEVKDSVEKDSKDSNVGAPGQKLKRARENKNLEQADIASELKLDLRFVRALEEGRYNELPQPVYTAGYVRAYSKLVGLAPDEIVSEYTSQQKLSGTNKQGEKEKEHIPSHYRAVQDELPKSFSVGHAPSEDKRKFNVLISILAVVVVFAIIWQVSNKQDDTESVAVPPEEISQPSTDSTSTETTTDDLPITSVPKQPEGQRTVDLPLPKLETDSSERGAQQGVQQGADQNSSISDEDSRITEELADNAKKLTELSIHYSEDSWVDIRDATGKPIIRRLGRSGKTSTVTGVPPFEVLLGYSPGVTIEYDGKPYDMSPYSEKRVARFVLDDTSVKTDVENTSQEP